MREVHEAGYIGGTSWERIDRGILAIEAEARQQDGSGLRDALGWLDGHADHALSFHRGWGPDEDFPEPEPAAFSCASCEKEYVPAALPPSAPPALSDSWRDTGNRGAAEHRARQGPER